MSKRIEGRFKSPSPEMIYISHTWARDWNAYQVRVKERVACTFDWKVYGSARKALKAAQKFRDAVIPLVESLSTHYKGNLVYPKDSQYPVGVNKVNSKGCEAFVANWLDNGSHRSKFFSINKYGEERALQLAIDAREQAVGMYPVDLFNEISELKAAVKQEQAKLRHARIGRKA